MGGLAAYRSCRAGRRPAQREQGGEEENGGMYRRTGRAAWGGLLSDGLYAAGGCVVYRVRRARCASGVGAEPFTYPRVSCGQCTRCGNAHRGADGVAVDTFSSVSGSERCVGDTIRFGDEGRQKVLSAGRHRLLPAGVRAVAARIGEYLPGNRTVSVIPFLSCPRRSAGEGCKKPAPNIGAGFLGTGCTSAVRQTVMRIAACYFVAMYLMSSTTLLE